jgi:DNA repair protein RadD
MKLRDYQEAAVTSIFRYFEEGGTGNPLVALPTGTGKSLIITRFMQIAYGMYPGQRFMKLTHVKELIEQNFNTLMKIWPTAPAGIYSSGLGRWQSHFPITFAGIASVVKNPELFGKVDLIFIDEAHLVSPKEGTMYRSFLKEFKARNPLLKIIGFTATHYRLGQGLLIEGEDRLFTDICFDMTTLESFNWLLSEGYICNLIPRQTTTEIDTSGIRVQAGEFVQKDLQEAVDKDVISYAICREIIQRAEGRNHWLIFAAGIDHAIHVRSILESLGVSATLVHSRMSEKERDTNLADYKAGKYKAMVNNGILTTGFDFPEMDLIGMLRPTQSPGLWVQMLGRGTRPIYAPGYDLETKQGRLDAQKAGPKQDCLVLDFAGNTRRLGPINDPIIPRKKGKKEPGAAPVKICEVCGTYNHISVRYCISCGAEFPKEVKFAPGASTEALIAESSPQVADFQVARVTYTAHHKADKPTSIRVSYYCGLRLFEEWVCLEHPGYPRAKARKWWRDRTGPNVEPPLNTLEGLNRLKELKIPKTIKVWVNRKHPEVMSYGF